jgi:hypothetical protein
MLHQFWHWILWVLCIAAHDPTAIEAERARAAGCVNVAYSALTPPPAPAPAPEKPSRPTCRECDGSGKIFRNDGGYVRCKCGACPTGQCKTPAATR